MHESEETTRANALDGFGQAVLSGLTASPKTLPCKYFYDDEGSRIFEEICRLPEYYVTRTERAILEAHAGDIIWRLPNRVDFIELGSGSAEKTTLLLTAARDRESLVRYLPVDVSPSALQESSARLLRLYPGLEIQPIVGEYDAGLLRVREYKQGAAFVIWLGGGFGNLQRTEFSSIFESIRAIIGTDGFFLIGIDLVKDRDLLERAYADSQGVTARFNKNILRRINDMLGGDFRLEKFEHSAVYNEEHARVEMHLVSSENQTVSIRNLDVEVEFARGESIHTENSYKFTIDDIDSLAQEFGFVVAQRWLDPRRYFSVNLLANAR